MAQYKIPYKGVAHSLIHLRKQVLDSISYCCNNIPNFETPKQLFYYLKKRTTYEPDPHNIELFQTVQTLFNNNFHNKSGAGDCDDFTILSLSCLISMGYYNTGIVLAGRQQGRPSHIYAYVDTEQGREYFDLTNPEFNQQRYYPFKEEIPFLITHKQIDMFLQLADSPKSNRGKKLNFNPYILIPSKGLKVREDLFDDLSLNEFSEMMLSEGYEVTDVQQLASRRTERKAERPRQVKKADKHTAKMEKKASKTEARQARSNSKIAKAESKAEARETRARAKETKAEAKRIRAESGEEEPATKLINKGGQFIGRVVDGKLQPAEEETDETENYGGEESTEQETQPEESEGEELNEGLSGFYANAFKKIFGKESTSKNKTMKKMSPEQKAKIKGRFKKVQDYVQSGKLQAVTGTATRYAQGKPIILKKETKTPIKTDTYNIFGQELPKPLVWGGGIALVLGGVALAKKGNLSLKRS